MIRITKAEETMKKIKEFWHGLRGWQKGGIVGFLTGLILFFVTFADIWSKVSILEKIIFYPFLFSEHIFRFKYGICEGMACIFYFWGGGILGYIILGLITGFIIGWLKSIK